MDVALKQAVNHRDPALLRDMRRAPAAATVETADLIIENIRCGACMPAIEMALQRVRGVLTARVNLAAKRAKVVYDSSQTSTDALLEALASAGYRAAHSIGSISDADLKRDDDLLRRLGIAGFAAANIMLLSVSVWAGVASDMSPAVKSLFHWLSALIALPAIAYAGQPFFSSAAAALRARRLNMDVPISLGITLATAMSLFQTIQGTEQVYFDAAITLCFFLLIGRYLDERVRIKARSAAEGLLSLKALTAHVIQSDGNLKRINAQHLRPGMRMLVASGERIPADGRITKGQSDIEESLITGETLPRTVNEGAQVHAGTLNISAPIEIQATATNDNTLAAEISRLIEAATQNRDQYVRLADRAARLYAPAVHILSAGTFTGWFFYGAGWEQALTYAIAVLIITCPCALALAVPAVQVAATSRLFQRGIILKAADGLERLAEADTIVFDKTGTLTLGEPALVNGGVISDDVLSDAAAIAAASCHPYARAILREAERRGLAIKPADGVMEAPGLGLSSETPFGMQHLGSAKWCAISDYMEGQAAALYFTGPRMDPVAFHFKDTLRPDAAEVIGSLRSAGYDVELLSGDRPQPVKDAARSVGIVTYAAGIRPEQKIKRLEALKRAGRKAVMIGDGLNDAPALASAHASLSPSTAADISQTSADAIFQGAKLGPVLETIKVARAARQLAMQNFAIALHYNCVFVPLAIMGYVTPLLAALAMSGSSVAVVLNAVRLKARHLKLHSVERTA